MGERGELFRLDRGRRTRWFSFENPGGGIGEAARTNLGAKGNAWEPIAAGETKVLADFAGSGTVDRMWFTLRPFTPRMLRSLVLEIYWDGSATPAVAVPFGDFFNQPLAIPSAGESELFSNPEERSFNSYVPMPFRRGVRVQVRNDSSEDVGLFFYEIDVTEREHEPDLGYFHAFWNRTRAVPVGEDYVLLPKVAGRGRFLGASVGIQANPAYGASGWCEGEVKLFLDGDSEHPTLANTGTEDYIGTGWGMSPFHHRFQGCTVADAELMIWGFYRFHIPDPVYFETDCRVTLQDIGGEGTAFVRNLVAQGADLVPVTAATAEGLVRLLEDPYPDLSSEGFTLDAWVNFYRSDDFSSVAYFYLDRPESGLPPLAGVEERTVDLRKSGA